jgi:hypothetical protein
MLPRSLSGEDSRRSKLRIDSRAKQGTRAQWIRAANRYRNLLQWRGIRVSSVELIAVATGESIATVAVDELD